MEKFLKECLGLTNFETEKLTSWNQCLTEKVSLSDGQTFIVQNMLSLKTAKNVEFKKKVFEVLEQSDKVRFAKNVEGFDRFYNFEWDCYQVMEILPGHTFLDDDYKKEYALEMAEILAHWHKELSVIDVIGYEDIDFSRVMFKIRAQLQGHMKTCEDPELVELFEQMEVRLDKLKENPDLPKWIIHWDPIYRNFCVDGAKVTGIIDYERACPNTLLWDIAEMLKWFFRFEEFDNDTFWGVIERYDKIRPLTPLEREELENYMYMINLDVAYRFLLSEFDSNYRNLHNNTPFRIRRYLAWHDMVPKFFQN